MKRKYADYEYRTKTGKVRIEKGKSGWMWRFFGNDGKYESSNEQGELYNLKREAKQAGLEYAGLQ